MYRIWELTTHQQNACVYLAEDASKLKVVCRLLSQYTPKQKEGKKAKMLLAHTLTFLRAPQCEQGASSLLPPACYACLRLHSHCLYKLYLLHYTHSTSTDCFGVEENGCSEKKSNREESRCRHKNGYIIRSLLFIRGSLHKRMRASKSVSGREDE